MAMAEINTHHLKIEFGRHKGELFTRLPVSYLKWMVNTSTQQADIAAAELKRRGTTTPTLDVSGHAIDRASEFCLGIWQRTRHDGEGIHAWLCRVSIEALAANDVDGAGRYRHLGMRFAFETKLSWPVLTTVMIDENPKKGDA